LLSVQDISLLLTFKPYLSVATANADLPVASRRKQTCLLIISVLL